MKRQRPSWVAHMTLRQLASFIVAISAVLALIFVDSRSTVAQIDEVEGTKQEVAMPYVSAANMLATSWFCPGVPGNDDSIASVIGWLFCFAMKKFFIAGAASETARAAPSAEPICRAVVLRAEPIANLAGGKNAFAELESVDMLQPTPIPVTIIHGR